MNWYHITAYVAVFNLISFSICAYFDARYRILIERDKNAVDVYSIDSLGELITVAALGFVFTFSFTACVLYKIAIKTGIYKVINFWTFSKKLALLGEKHRQQDHDATYQIEKHLLDKK